MTYKAPRAIAAEEIKMTKLTLRHMFVLGLLLDLNKMLPGTPQSNRL